MRLLGGNRDVSVDHELCAGVSSVGRSEDNDIVLATTTVSRRHAEVSVEKDRVTVRDLASLNGTRINGSVILSEQRLNPGDRVDFGSVRLHLISASAPGTDTVSWSAASDLSRRIERSAADLSTPDALDASTSARVLELIFEAGQILVRPENPTVTFDRFLTLLDRAMKSDRCLLLERDAEGALHPRSSRTHLENSGSLLMSRTLIDLVLQNRTSILTSDAQTDERFRNHVSIMEQGLRSAIAVPLVHAEEVLGVLYLDTRDPQHVYGESDLQLVTLLGQMLGAKLANSHLLEVEHQQLLLSRELETAAAIQYRLLPQELPPIPGYEVAGMQTTCEAVGGDLYDIATLENGRVQIILGDISGKGIGAALLMSDVLATLRALRHFMLPIEELAKRVHRHIIETTESERYLTLFLAELDPSTHEMVWVNAGHPPARVVGSDGTIRLLQPTAPCLGLLNIPQLRFERGTQTFAPGDRMMITSDGIDESCRGDDSREFYADGMMDEFLRGSGALQIEEFVERLLDDLSGFREDTCPSDDITLVVLHRHGGTSGGEGP